MPVMTPQKEWPRRQIVTSSAQARMAVATLRRECGWHHTPELRMASLLAPWFQQGWCLAAIEQAWERTPNGLAQTDGHPKVDAVGALAARLKYWRDDDGRPMPPPFEAWTDIQCRAERARRADPEPVLTLALEIPGEGESVGVVETEPQVTVAAHAEDLTLGGEDSALMNVVAASADAVVGGVVADSAGPDVVEVRGVGADPAGVRDTEAAVAEVEPAGPRRRAARPRPESIPRAFGEQLADMDLKLGLERPAGRMTEPEQSFPAVTDEYRQRYRDYLAELLAQIRRDGPQSLTPAQRSVLRTRARSLKGLHTMAALEG